MDEDCGISLDEARMVLRRAIPAVAAGDVTAIEFFTEDVAGDAEDLDIQSRTELENQLLDRSGVLSRVTFHMDFVEEVVEGVLATWRLSGDHTAAVLVNEDHLIEATGRRVELSATTFARFRGPRICSFRTFFVGPSLLTQIHGPTPPGMHGPSLSGR